MTKQRFVIDRKDRGGFEFNEFDFQNPTRTPQGDVPTVRDGAKEQLEAVLWEAALYFDVKPEDIAEYFQKRIKAK